MNALQSLTGGPAAGAAGIGMPSRGPGQSLGGMGGLGTMGQPMPLSGQPPPGTSGMAPHGMAVVSTAAPQSEYRASQRICLLCRRRAFYSFAQDGIEESVQKLQVALPFYLCCVWREKAPNLFRAVRRVK